MEKNAKDRLAHSFPMLCISILVLQFRAAEGTQQLVMTLSVGISLTCLFFQFLQSTWFRLSLPKRRVLRSPCDQDCWYIDLVG